MSYRFTLRKFFPLVIISLCWVSCVDNGYDLGDLDTDDITVGDKWSVKLATGTLSAAELLDADNVGEIYTDATGDFIARYANVISVLPAKVPTIKDQSFAVDPVQVNIPSTGQIPAGGMEVSVPPVSRVLAVEGSEEIIDLYSAEFDAGYLTVTMDLAGFTVENAVAEIEITLPDGYRVGGTPPAVDGTHLRWTAPLGNAGSYSVSYPLERIDMTGNKTMSITGKIVLDGGSVVNIAGEPGIAFSVGLEDIGYSVIYGTFDILFESEAKTADIGKLYDIFDDDDAVLSFRDPYIIIRSESNIGMPVAASLDIYPDTDPSGTDAVTVDDILIPAATQYGQWSEGLFWIGEADNAPAGYTFKYAGGLGDVIKNSRELVYLSGSGRSAPGAGTLFFPAGAVADLDYTVEIPLAPAEDFYAVSLQVVEDAFGDLIDYLFAGGTVEIFGTATNGIPLAFDLEMIVTDYQGEPVVITLPPQEIKEPVSRSEPSVSEISFFFDESAVARMADARDMVLRFVARGVKDAPALNVGHELVLDLKLRKSGGIQVGSNDD